MCDPEEELRGWCSPERRIDEIHEQFLNSVDNFVRSYWLIKTLNLPVFPETLHARHQKWLAHATELVIALQKVGQSHPDVLAPRTAGLLNGLFPAEIDATRPQASHTRSSRKFYENRLIS